jgi:hypothetical protein
MTCVLYEGRAGSTPASCSTGVSLRAHHLTRRRIACGAFRSPHERCDMRNRCCFACRCAPSGPLTASS